MAYRFDLKKSEQMITIVFQGLLDRQALTYLETLCRARKGSEKPVQVLLGVGTNVERDVLENLVRLDGIDIAAESPFLSRWLQRCGQQEQSRRKEQQ